MRIIAGSLKNRRIIVPRAAGIRPTSNKLREAVFNVLQNEIVGAKFLDLFAGSGAMGLEALSRGADSAVFVDRSGRFVSCLKKNVSAMEVGERSSIILRDALEALEKFAAERRRFDIIYSDPPYSKEDLNREVLSIVGRKCLLRQGGFLLLEGRREIGELEACDLLLFKKLCFGETSLCIYRREYGKNSSLSGEF